MGGLATGTLGKAGYEVEIYDRVSNSAPERISLWSNGVKVLNSLGLSKEIASIGGQMDRVAYYNTGEKLTDFSVQPLVDQVGRPYPVAH